MSNIEFQGVMYALVNGLLVDDADVRGKLVMSGFSGGDTDQEDAINLADLTTVDEFDGTGYQELDCENVTMAYDATADEYQLNFDAGEFNGPGSTVSAGSDDFIGIIWYLYVDGTEANDIILTFTDDGTGFPGNGVGTALTYTPATDGPIYLGKAA